MDNDEKHTDLMTAIGTAHSLFWQIIPYCSIVAKFAEAANASPVFVAKDYLKLLGGGEWRREYSYDKFKNDKRAVFVNANTSFLINETNRPKLLRRLCGASGDKLPKGMYVEFQKKDCEGKIYFEASRDLLRVVPRSGIDDGMTEDQLENNMRSGTIVRTTGELVESSGDMYFGCIRNESGSFFVVQLHYIVVSINAHDGEDQPQPSFAVDYRLDSEDVLDEHSGQKAIEAKIAMEEARERINHFASREIDIVTEIKAISTTLNERRTGEQNASVHKGEEEKQHNRIRLLQRAQKKIAERKETWEEIESSRKKEYEYNLEQVNKNFESMKYEIIERKHERVVIRKGLFSTSVDTGVSDFSDDPNPPPQPSPLWAATQAMCPCCGQCVVLCCCCLCTDTDHNDEWVKDTKGKGIDGMWWSTDYCYISTPVGLCIPENRSSEEVIQIVNWCLHIAAFVGQTGICFSPSEELWVYVWMIPSLLLAIITMLVTSGNWKLFVKYAKDLGGGSSKIDGEDAFFDESNISNPMRSRFSQQQEAAAVELASTATVGKQRPGSARRQVSIKHDV